MTPSPTVDHPRARADLDVNEVPEGLVIYDGDRDRVHYLNATAGAVFALCTGDLSPARIAEEVGRIFELDRSAEPETTRCLDDLRREGLLT